MFVRITRTSTSTDGKNRQKRANNGNLGHRNSETDVERQMYVIVAKIKVSKSCFFLVE